MISLAISWIVILTSFIGNGLLFSRILSKQKSSLFQNFWFGVIFEVIILQLVSIFSAINIYILVLLLLTSVLGFILNPIKLPRLGIINTILLIGVLYLISLQALKTVSWYDTYLYHFNAVEWANNFPVVPGLANLHGRLGFSSSIFLLGALYKNLPIPYISEHALIPLMYIVVLFNILIRLREKSEISKLFYLPILYFLIKLPTGGSLPSYSTDNALAIITIALTLELASKKINHQLVSLLAMLIFTVKMSGLFFLPLALIYPFLFIHKKRKTLFCLLLTLVGYISRNLIVSGWPLYPLPALGIYSIWSVPKETVIEMQKIVTSWARTPGENHLNSLNQPFTTWIQQWYVHNRYSPEIWTFVISIFLLLFLAYKYFHSSRPSTNLLIISLYSLGGIAVMFFGAPDLRFGAIYFWLLLASLIAVLKIKVPTVLLVPGILLFIVLFFNLKYTAHVIIFDTLHSLRYSFVKLEKPEEKELTTLNQPIFSYRPVSDDRCGDSPLPCSPEISNKLNQIDNNDYSKGFTIKQ